jgi:hypothetical protein
MGFFSKLMAAFTGKAPSGSDRYLPIYVLDHRCREAISGQVDMLNELSLAEEGGYYVRKVLHTSGKSRCFGQVEVELWLDGKKHVTRHEVQGGRWLTAEEYAAEIERQAQEAEDAADDASDTAVSTESTSPEAGSSGEVNSNKP